MFDGVLERALERQAVGTRFHAHKLRVFLEPIWDNGAWFLEMNYTLNPFVL